MKNKCNNHILHIPRWYPYLNNQQSGIFIKKQIKSLSSFNNSVVFVRGSDKTDHSYFSFIQEDSLSQYYYIFPHKNKFYNGFQTLIGYKKTIHEAIKTNGKPKLIHAHVLLRTFIIGAILKFVYRIPLIFSEHWTGYNTGLFDKKNTLYKLTTNLIFRQCDLTIVVSNRLKKDLITKNLTEKAIVIPNIVTPSYNIKSTKNQDKLKFVTVSDLYDAGKDISTIIKVMKILIPHFNIEYHIIGDGIDRYFLEQIADKHLNKEIIFHGVKSNNQVLECLPQFDVLISNSPYETFGIIVPEAITANLPIICTTVGCPDEVLDMPIGLFIPPQSPDQLKNAIIQMINTHTKYNIDSSRKKVVHLFSEPVIGQQLIKEYNQLLTPQSKI